MFRNCYFSINIFLSESMKTYMIICVCLFSHLTIESEGGSIRVEGMLQIFSSIF